MSSSSIQVSLDVKSLASYYKCFNLYTVVGRSFLFWDFSMLLFKREENMERSAGMCRTISMNLIIRWAPFSFTLITFNSQLNYLTCDVACWLKWLILFSFGSEFQPSELWHQIQCFDTPPTCKHPWLPCYLLGCRLLFVQYTVIGPLLVSLLLGMYGYS